MRGGYFWWPKTGTSRGHQWVHQLATSGYFFMATDKRLDVVTRSVLIGILHECEAEVVLAGATDVALCPVHSVRFGGRWSTSTFNLRYYRRLTRLNGELRPALSGSVLWEPRPTQGDSNLRLWRCTRIHGKPAFVSPQRGVTHYQPSRQFALGAAGGARQMLSAATYL